MYTVHHHIEIIWISEVYSALYAYKLMIYLASN